MIKIPSTNQWVQTNVTDKFGNYNAPNDVYISKNLDFTENEGRMRLGKRLVLNTSTADVAELTSYPAGFRFFNPGGGSVLFTIAGTGGTGYVFKTTTYPNLDGSFSKVTTAGAPTDLDSTTSDIEIGFNELYVSSLASQKIYYVNTSGTWSSFSLATTLTYPLMMTSYGDRMYVTNNGNQIVSWNSSHTLATLGAASTLSLPSDYVITFMRAASNRIWIGTINQFGGRGYIYEWDGAANQVTKSYRLESTGALSCVVKDDIPYVIDANGKLLVWNGGTFKTVSKLFRRKNKVLFGANAITNARFIHPNGMSIIRNKISAFIDGTNFDANSHGGTQEETIPSGVYEYDETSGLVNKYSVGLSKIGGTISDYGQTRIYGAGALQEIIPGQSVNTTNGTFLVGASYYTDATTVKSGIFYDDNLDTVQKGGIFVSGKIYSPAVMETFQSLYYRFKKLISSNDKIVVKYRVEDQDPIEATITWTSTTTFTVPNSAVVVSNYWTSGIGGEVEVVQGIGSGKCSHITNAVNNAGTWTVTVDETYTGATGTSIARFQNWIKQGSNVYGDSHTAFNNLQFPLLATSTWVQIKVWMLFTGRQELDDLQLQTKASQTANK